RTTGQSRRWLREAPSDQTSRTPRPKAGSGRANASASPANHRHPVAPALADQREFAPDAAVLPTPSAAASAAAIGLARAVVQRPPAAGSSRAQRLIQRCLRHYVAIFLTRWLRKVGKLGQMSPKYLLPCGNARCQDQNASSAGSRRAEILAFGTTI